LKGKNTLKNY